MIKSAKYPRLNKNADFRAKIIWSLPSFGVLLSSNKIMPTDSRQWIEVN